jgi:hypothetical protein
MPVHLDSIVKESDEFQYKVLDGILQNDLVEPDSFCMSKDKKITSATKYILNKNKEKIGKTVVTFRMNDDGPELLDVDLTLLSQEPVKLFFDKRLDASSDANEYYDVHDVKDERHFQIETVNRCSLHKESIVDSEEEVYLSVFPFQLDVFDSVDDFNKKAGFDKPIKSGDFEIEIPGFSEDYVGVGGLFLNNLDVICSAMIGKVVSFEDMTIIIGGIEFEVVIIKLNTGIGIIPLVVSKDVFDLTKLDKDKTIVMIGDIKADFVK